MVLLPSRPLPQEPPSPPSPYPRGSNEGPGGLNPARIEPKGSGKWAQRRPMATPRPRTGPPKDACNPAPFPLQKHLATLSGLHASSQHVLHVSNSRVPCNERVRASVEPRGWGMHVDLAARVRVCRCVCAFWVRVRAVPMPPILLKKYYKRPSHSFIYT